MEDLLRREIKKVNDRLNELEIELERKIDQLEQQIVAIARAQHTNSNHLIYLNTLVRDIVVYLAPGDSDGE